MNKITVIHVPAKDWVYVASGHTCHCDYLDMLPVRPVNSDGTFEICAVCGGWLELETAALRDYEAIGDES